MRLLIGRLYAHR
jgi:hypothetical protein